MEEEDESALGRVDIMLVCPHGKRRRGEEESEKGRLLY